MSKISPFLPPLEKLFPVMFLVFWFELKKVVFVAKFIRSNQISVYCYQIDVLKIRHLTVKVVPGKVEIL